ncbi:MAG: AbrB/MazE/SpoVT family DNA-binding domain-containing protein [Cyanobacteria bacterium J06626_23]
MIGSVITASGLPTAEPLTPVGRTRIVKIGNSQGIRIPKPVLEQLDMAGEVELLVEAGQLVIRKVESPRCHWAAQFEAMAANGDDAPLDADYLATDWDEDEWTW